VGGALALLHYSAPVQGNSAQMHQPYWSQWYTHQFSVPVNYEAKIDNCNILLLFQFTHLHANLSLTFVFYMIFLSLVLYDPSSSTKRREFKSKIKQQLPYNTWQPDYRPLMWKMCDSYRIYHHISSLSLSHICRAINLTDYAILNIYFMN